MTNEPAPRPHIRIEEDALGHVEVPAEHLWGAQTQRSHLNFPIGVERFRWGRPVIRALGILKKCAALANGELGQLPKQKVDLIVRAAQEVIDGKWDRRIPAGGVPDRFGNADQHERQRGDRQPRHPARRRRCSARRSSIHPNDDVNHSQSSNDTFPTVMHIATVEQMSNVLIPAVGICATHWRPSPRPSTTS